ncbi:NAD(P)H-dependent oxidoreductase [Yeosuana sp. MJ-SS3]|uniref:NAD(P)H-dependent oxidoreductase n=1 Tax=Gilvirhabdus luticola TaxID=3079858 RepID=A0ABU3U7K3_9FLAO|nr:NAD(P)H-dependent oxidoreductase [Yeosuana sp. MJ-SS3]MDU8886302.1 NAD(P)H-dependent oxidoreductase [Yeosuana sp. MJ-SS3]
MNVIEHLKWRYATKKFDANKHLSPQKVQIIKEAFNLTATSFGLQTISMLVVADKDIRKNLIEHSYGQRQVLEASHLLVLCIQDNITDTDVDDLFDNIQDKRHTSNTILDPYRDDLKRMMQQMSVQERQEWSTKQAYIALGNLMTVCAIEQIDACPMEGFFATKYDDIFQLKDKGLKSVLVMPIGYRAEDDMFADFKKVRKTIAESTIEL